jgi:hypothetical protein
MDVINSEFKNTDVVIVLGANDVVNPAAMKDPSSPIAGMPILNAHEARSVFVVKRSLSPGYAGIKNELFEYDNTMMIFGDAKKVLQGLIGEVKDVAGALAWFGFNYTTRPPPPVILPAAAIASLCLGGAFAPGFALRARTAVGGMGAGSLGARCI